MVRGASASGRGPTGPGGVGGAEASATLPVDSGRLGGGVAVVLGPIAIVLRKDLSGVIDQHAQDVVACFALDFDAVFGGLADRAAGLDHVQDPLGHATACSWIVRRQGR